MPPPVPTGAAPIEIVLHYIGFYEADYARARRVVKRRAREVVVGTAVATGSIAVLGAAIAVWHASWLGVVSTGLAAAVSVLAAWEGLARHRQLWIQRSLILNRVQQLKRTVEYRRARGDNEQALADEAMKELNDLLKDDVESWASVTRPPAGAELQTGTASS